MLVAMTDWFTFFAPIVMREAGDKIGLEWLERRIAIVSLFGSHFADQVGGLLLEKTKRWPVY